MIGTEISGAPASKIAHRVRGALRSAQTASYSSEAWTRATERPSGIP